MKKGEKKEKEAPTLSSPCSLKNSGFQKQLSSVGS